MPANPQTSTKPTDQRGFAGELQTTPRSLSNPPNYQSVTLTTSETGQYRQNVFDNGVPIVIIVPTAYGAPGYFRLSENVGFGAEDNQILSIEQPDVMVIDLGAKPYVGEPNYSQGDAMVDLNLLRF
ncbi:MAG: hypothetical protein VKL59_18590 [Nostocaceae cyanobacterium]|nr:hypothetical protein [Nostocaceae cyanobacterium]